MKTIIIPTDFSPAALNAVNYAADMAKAIDADLLLFHTFFPFITYSAVPTLVDTDVLKENAELSINQLKKQLEHKCGNRLNIKTIVKMGTFINELESVCEDIQPYAVVMGSQGSSASDYRFFGSHSVHAMQQLKWPVITIPRGAQFSEVKKIGLSFDFENEIDRNHLKGIKKMVHDFNAELHVLNISKKNQHSPHIIFESGLLMEMLAPINHEYHFIINENIDEGIIDFAEKNNIDLLIVMPKQHNLLDKLIHGSHTKQLVLHSHVPVMALQD